MKKIVYPVLILILLFSFSLNSFAKEKPYPKNIIFFIGDGMGLATVTAAKIEAGNLAMEKLPHTGFVITFSKNNNLITDSAAAATALATGVKTDNGFISTTAEFNNGTSKIDTLKTVLEWAEEKGLSTGLVVTSSITHATPACFASHVSSRKLETEIARQLSNEEIEVLFGGGLQFFLKASEKLKVRKDNLDLLQIFKSKGYRVIKSYEEFVKLNPQITERVLGLFSPEGMPDIPERSPSLVEMTEKALQILQKNEKGFFLMVEGSQIDWKAHANNAHGVIDETLEFDRAIDAGIKFAESHPQTLIVVTADHETGGIALLHSGSNGLKVDLYFTTNHHTGVMVPIFAKGPGAEAFHGIMDNTFIGQKLIEYVKNRL
ncbi:MAG: alkaline phosphatase [Calditrichaeota bacterium]|nr:MAG: alkaline phosphatase [Calditrichota bacterium]